MSQLTGIKVIGIFILWVLLAEIGPALIGGDSAAFLYVTFHFILNPVLGLIVIIFAIWHALKQNNTWLSVITLIICCIPLAVIYIGISGDTWLPKFLGINFNK